MGERQENGLIKLNEKYNNCDIILIEMKHF